MEKLVVFAALVCFMASASAPEVVFETESYVVVAVLANDVFTLSDWREMKAETENRYKSRFLGKTIVVTRDATVYFGLKRALELNDDSEARYFAQKAIDAAKKPLQTASSGDIMN